MSKVIVTITGIKELHEAAAKMPVVAAKEISLATERSMNAIWKNSMKEAPVNKQTGGCTLRQSIRGRMTSRFSGIIIAYAKYSAAVNDGTVPHIIRYKGKGRGGLYNERTKQGFGRVVHHPGTRPNPFFNRAIDRSMNVIQVLVDKALQNILKTIK